MNEYLSINPLREEFITNDEEYRYAYAEDFLNTYIATQIKVLRDKRGMTQKDLAEAIGTKQPGIARLENVNYSNWKTETLKKVARAFGLRLKISFETFGSLLEEDANFSRGELERSSFAEDPAFSDEAVEAEASLPDLKEVIKALDEKPPQSNNVRHIEDYLNVRQPKQAMAQLKGQEEERRYGNSRR